MPAIKIVDLETSVKCPVGNHKAHPMWLGNKVVAYGELLTSATLPYVSYDKVKTVVAPATYTEDFLIGHNIKFDLLYLYRNNAGAYLPNIWDTQLAEYLLTGQQHKYASLDELTLKYVGKHALKDSDLKKHWDSGGQTEDIDKDKLIEYLTGDLTNTKAIFLKQWEAAEKEGLIQFILTQMEALRATTSMNLSGMAIDWDYIDRQIIGYDSLLQNLEEDLYRVAKNLEWKSPKELSLYFFGGEYKVVEKQLVGKFKNGNDKYKNVEVVMRLPAKVSPLSVGATLNGNGYYNTDEAVINELRSGRFHKDVTDVANYVKDLREYSKIKTTYYEGIRDLRFPDGMLYPNLNHCVTATGRLSSTNPNLQNQTDKGGIKKCFISRFGNDGAILELDFGQLEIVALAYLSDDKQLKADINSGTDMHTVLYEELNGRLPTKAERKAFKPLSFLLIYGGGAKALAEQSGFDLDYCKRFIATFYNRYKGVKAYHDRIVQDARMGRDIEYTADGKLVATYTLKSVTGRKYVFKEYENSWGTSFSPTELKNYPVQGFATGDIVPTMLGILQRKLEEKGFGHKYSAAMLINTVHDSVLLDVKLSHLKEVALLCKTVLEDSPRYLKELFGITFGLKLTVGVDAGPSWGEMKPLEF